MQNKIDPGSEKIQTSSDISDNVSTPSNGEFTQKFYMRLYLQYGHLEEKKGIRSIHLLKKGLIPVNGGSEPESEIIDTYAMNGSAFTIAATDYLKHFFKNSGLEFVRVDGQIYDTFEKVVERECTYLIQGKAIVKPLVEQNLNK